MSLQAPTSPTASHAERCPLRVLLLSPTGAGVHYNGPATAMHRLFGAVLAQHEVSLTLVHASTDQTGDTLFDGIVAMPPIDGRTRSLGETINRLRYLRAVDRWLKVNWKRFDVMLIPASNALTLLPAQRARRRGLPVISRIATSDTELRTVTGMRALLGWTKRRVALMNKLDRVIALSMEIEQRLVAYGMQPDKIVRLPNSADCERFHPTSASKKEAARERFRIPQGARFVVVCVGALGFRKGQPTLARAVSELDDAVHLLLVGPVRDQGALQDVRAAFDQAPDRLHIVDHIEDVEQAYWAADVFVLPSNNEGMPNALVEAMACGLPSIGTPISGITDLLADGNRGAIVPRDEAAIARAINTYVADPILCQQHGNAARRHIVQHQSRNACAQKMYDILTEVSTNRKTGPAS